MRSATRQGGRGLSRPTTRPWFALSVSDTLRTLPASMLNLQSEVGKLYLGAGVGIRFGEDDDKRWQAWLVAVRSTRRTC